MLDNRKSPVGKMSFSSSSFSSPDNMKLLTCSKSTKDTAVTQTHKSDKYKVEFDWSAPPGTISGQQFKLRCTAVMVFSRCWTNLQADITIGTAVTKNSTEATKNSTVDTHPKSGSSTDERRSTKSPAVTPAQNSTSGTDPKPDNSVGGKSSSQTASTDSKSVTAAQNSTTVSDSKSPVGSSERSSNQNPAVNAAQNIGKSQTASEDHTNRTIMKNLQPSTAIKISDSHGNSGSGNNIINRNIDTETPNGQFVTVTESNTISGLKVNPNVPNRQNTNIQTLDFNTAQNLDQNSVFGASDDFFSFDTNNDLLTNSSQEANLQEETTFNPLIAPSSKISATMTLTVKANSSSRQATNNERRHGNHNTNPVTGQPTTLKPGSAHTMRP